MSTAPSPSGANDDEDDAVGEHGLLADIVRAVAEHDVLLQSWHERSG